MPCRLLVVSGRYSAYPEASAVFELHSVSASDGEGNGGVIQHILKGTVPSHIEIPFKIPSAAFRISVDNRLNFPVSNSPADLTCVTFQIPWHTAAVH